MATRKPLLTVVVDSQGGRKRFYEAEEFRSWFEKEAETFAWVGDPPERDYNNLKRQLNQHRNELQSATGADDPVVQRIQRQIDGIYPNKLFASEDPRGHFILELKQEGSHVGRGAYLALRGEPADATARGAAEAALFLRGDSYTGGAALDLLSETLDEWRSKHADLAEKSADAFDGQMATQSSTFDELKSKVEALHGDQIQNQQDRQAEHDTLQATVKEELGALKTRYEEYMRTRAPVEYWRGKAKGHTWSAAGLAIFAAVGALLLGYELIQLVQTIVSGRDAPARGGAAPAGEGTGGIVLFGGDFVEFFTLLTVATLGVWALRVVVRLLLSQAHLASDCRERAVMSETYYSMLDDKTINPEERQLALASLFRPSTTGVVKDDAAPPTLFDLVARRVTHTS